MPGTYCQRREDTHSLRTLSKAERNNSNKHAFKHTEDTVKGRNKSNKHTDKGKNKSANKGADHTKEETSPTDTMNAFIKKETKPKI